MKDLDILYILGNWNEEMHAPESIMVELYERIDKEYKNPTKYHIKVSLQTHSVTVIFLSDHQEVFSVDIVPAYIYSKNEFNDDKYMIPEVIRRKHGKNRLEYYDLLDQEHRKMGWLNTDPKGYIEIAKRVNKDNPDFRKAVKLIKSWKNSCKNKYEHFELKSFILSRL